MAVKRKTIHNFVWQKLVPTYRRDINKFPKICFKNVLPTYSRDVLIGEYIWYRKGIPNWMGKYWCMEYKMQNILLTVMGPWKTYKYNIDSIWLLLYKSCILRVMNAKKNICLSSSVYVHLVTCICLSTIKLGMAIAENVLDAVYKSRKTIIVMSKNFLKSMWGQYELQQAHNKAIVKVTVINHVIYL